MNQKDTLLGGGAVGLLLDATLNSFDLLLGSFDLLLGSVDLLYPMVIVGSRIAPALDWLDESLMTDLMLVVASLYLLHLTLRLKRRYTNERR
ncbi:hypothetical protein HSRCO_0747 [Halanaeroarchaeum sp. HSR-CO]|uniref:hypothetical protein n=1 Tax=Halanaeroarchaeum sp. HSR-CO TaxID=2866382 RepID=UPI00217E17E6|nr:hypothetical protein [Halanaeroarchaeum sp. HSR-CO]UWG47041.1 hypothetical protein HSRCO_0747 [Halanaeroarchaeum sp. HSR-CO]